MRIILLECLQDIDTDIVPMKTPLIFILGALNILTKVDSAFKKDYNNKVVFSSREERYIL